MRSLYMIMAVFILVFLLMGLLLDLGHGPLGKTRPSLQGTEDAAFWSNHGRAALPWQLDAVSMDDAGLDNEEDVPSQGNVREISLCIKPGPVKSVAPEREAKAKG